MRGKMHCEINDLCMKCAKFKQENAPALVYFYVSNSGIPRGLIIVNNCDRGAASKPNPLPLINTYIPSPL